MHRASRRHAALLSCLVAVLAVVGLASCVRADADLTVESRTNTVSGTIRLLAPIAEDTPETRQAASATVLAIENRALPGLRSARGVSAAPLAESGAFGTELTLEAVALASLRLGEDQLIVREGNEFVVSGALNAPGQDGVPAPETEGARPPGAEGSSIRIALTFPGAVEVPRGSVAQVDGRSVVWEGAWDEPILLEATAGATTAGAPPWIWKALAWGIGAVVVLALAGLATVWAVSRRD